jgi:hypothetical protein
LVAAPMARLVPSAEQMLVEDKAEPTADRADQPALLRPTRRRAGLNAPRRRFRWRWFIALGVVVALLAGLGGGGFLAYSSIRRDADQLQAQLTAHLELGQRELEAAKTSLKQANTTHDDKQIAQAKVHFINAKLQFLTASQIADSSELLGRLENLPSVGQLASSRHAAVDDISAMGIHLSQAGLELADLDTLLIKPPSSGQQGQGLLTMINQVKAKIDPVRAELTAAMKAADSMDVSLLPSGQKATFVRARGTIGQALVAIDQFKALVPILTEVLGGNGARTYLIEQLNPAELRPGGGFIGSYSLLVADHGVLSLKKSGNVTDLILPKVGLGNPNYIEPPGPIREWLPYVGWDFGDSNFFVDFPTNARKGMEFAQKRLGHIDAVIALDYFTVAKMLEVTGPIAVPGFNITLNADNFIPTVVKYGLDSLIDNNADAVHKAILFATAGPLFQKVVTLQPAQWPALVGALNDLAASHHIQVYFNNADVEKTVTQYGWAGVMQNSGASDYLMEVEANLGGTKANYYVFRHFTLELTHDRTNLHHRLSVEITNNTPYVYQGHDYYSVYARLLMSNNTAAWTNNLLHGPPGFVARTLPGPPPPAGLQQTEGWMNVKGYGNKITLVFNWDTPWTPNHRGEEQVYWQKQPGTNNDKVDVIWNDGNGHIYRTSGDLGQDRVITLASKGVTLTQGQVGTFQLPSLSLG